MCTYCIYCVRKLNVQTSHLLFKRFILRNFFITAKFNITDIYCLQSVKYIFRCFKAAAKLIFIPKSSCS